VFAHDCDTENGNSGSAVFDADSGQIVGIHIAGGGVGATRMNEATNLADTTLGKWMNGAPAPLPAAPAPADCPWWQPGCGRFCVNGVCR
jgi:hypothetical protein